MWIRTTRITLLVALLLAVAVLAYLAGNPQLYAADIGKLISRNLEDTGISFACRDLAGNPLRRLRFYGVSMTRRGDDGSFAYLTCDSLDVEYNLPAMLRRKVEIHDLVLYQPQLAIQEGSGVPLAADPEPATDPSTLDLRIDRAGVFGGSVQVTGHGGVVREQWNDLHGEGAFQASGAGREVTVHSFVGDLVSRGINVRSLSGTVRIQPDTVTWETVEVQTDSTFASSAGEARRGDAGLEGLEFAAAIGPAHLGEVLAALRLPPGPRLIMRNGSVAGSLRDGAFHLSGLGEGDLDHFPVQAELFESVIQDGVMTMTTMKGTFMGARGEATGEVLFDDKLLRVRGRASGADLSRPWTGQDLGWPASDLAGRFDLSLTLEEPRTLSMALDGVAGTMLETAVDSAAVRFTFHDATGLHVESSRVKAMGTVVQATGDIDLDQEAELAFRLHAADLTPWAERFNIAAVGTGLSAAGRLYGPITRASLRVGGDVETLGGFGLSGRGNRVIVEVDRVDQWDEVTGQVVIDQFQTRERLAGSLSVDLARLGERVHFDDLEFSRGDTTLVATGSVVPEAAGATIHLDRMRLRVSDHTWTMEDATTLSVGGRRFSADQLVIRSETGSIAVDGLLDLDGDWDLDVRVEAADLGLLAWAGLVPDVSGLVDVRARFEGTGQRPVASLDLTVGSPRYADWGVDSLTVQLTARDNSMDLTTLRAVSADGRATIAGLARSPSAQWMPTLIDDPQRWRQLWSNTTLDGTVDLDRANLDAWVRRPPPGESYGLASGRVTVRGSTEAPEVEGQVSIDGFQNQVVGLPRVEARLVTDDGGLVLRDGQILAPNPWLQFSGRLPLSVSAVRAPRWDADAGIELTLTSDGEVDLRPAGTVFPFFTRIEGRGVVDYRAQGPWRSPQLSGTVRVRDGVVQAREMLEQLREVSIDGVLEGDALRLTTITAREGEKGRISARGAVRFDGLKPDDIWLDIEGERVLVHSVPFLQAIGTSDNLKLRLIRPRPGGSRTPMITGDVVCDLALYTGEFDAAGATAEGGGLDATATPPWMADLRINARDQVRISNSISELRVQGDVDFSRDLSGLGLRGRVEIPQGRVRVGYLDFDIVRGQLDFSRGTNLEPRVDITAETEVPVRGGGGIGRELERVTVQVTGTFREPRFQFASESGYDEKTIVNLLAGVPPEGQEGAALRDVSVHIAGNILEDALAQQLGLIDTVDISTQEAGLEELGSTRIGVGKYLWNNVYLRFSSGLSISERDLFLEYQVSRRLLFTSELRRRLRENAAQTEFNVDLKFRVEY